MATKTMLITVAVVAVVLVASGVYLATRDNGGEGGSQVDAIGMDVSVGDYYTITSSQSASQPSPMTLAATIGSDQTKYTVTAIDENTGMIDVSVETPNGTSHETMAKEDFLDDVTVVDQAYIGEYQRNDTIAYAGKNVQCMVFMDQQNVGGATTVTTYDYIGVDSNVIYQTEIVIVSNNTTNTYRTTLTDTNMIGKESSTEVIVPEGSIQTGEIRTQLQVGDYIEFSKYDDDGRDIEGAEIVRINGDYIQYRELGDNDTDGTTVKDFLSLVLHDGSGNMIDSGQTLNTPFGTMTCNLYEVYWMHSEILDFDWEDRVVLWVAADSGIIYKIETYDDWHDDDDRWEDWYDDVESYYLTGTSLFGGTQQEPSTPGDKPSSSNRFGVTLEVNDYYTIQDGRDAETYQIISIDGDRLTVRETEGREVEVERMSANEFLGKIMMTSDQLSRWDSLNTTETINGVTCQVYQERYDDDRERIWVQQVGSNYIVWQKQEDRDDREILIEMSIASL